jgi:small subunit ribosomal protein S17
MEKNKQEKKQKRVLIGSVVSTHMQDTVVVKVITKRSHPLYKKILSSSKKYKAHTNKEVKVGDQVEIQQVRPISKTKSWIVSKVISK